MSKLGINPLYLPLNLKFEVKQFLNGHVIWFSSFLHCSKEIFDAPIILKVKEKERLLNTYLNNSYLKYYFVKNNVFRKKLAQKTSLLHIKLKQNIISVSVGYKQILSAQGVGYKFTLNSNILFLEAGYSHMLFFSWLNSFKTKFSRKLKGIQIKNHDIVQLTSFLSKIRTAKPMNIYTRKGIRYQKEIMKYKEGKRKKSF